MPVNGADTSWVLAATSLVLLMIPGLGLFYSGLTSHKNALSLIFLSFLLTAVVCVQWFIWGFSLSFGNGSPFIGNLDYAFYQGIETTDPIFVAGLPNSLFATFQSLYAAITPVLAVGAAAERSRIFPTIIFTFIWTTLVYNPISYWVWGPNGWAKQWGVLDFAGGNPVEITSGFSALALALVYGHRNGFLKAEDQPHNLFNVILGTALLWVGWLGFNGGSAFAANSRAAMAVLTSNIAAVFGGLTWVLLQYRHHEKLSSAGFCCGLIAGLVAITPACGFVHGWGAMVIGIVSSLVCHFASDLKVKLRFDDTCDVWAVHGVGGVIGCILTGVFASKSIAALDGTVITGGVIDGNPHALLVNFVVSVVSASYSFVVTAVILLVIDRIPGLSLRLHPDAESMGVDLHELGEYGYTYVTTSLDLQRDSMSLHALRFSNENPRDANGISQPGSGRVSFSAPHNIHTQNEMIEIGSLNRAEGSVRSRSPVRGSISAPTSKDVVDVGIDLGKVVVKNLNINNDSEITKDK
ncbi:ammonium transporter AmtB-like domain-containing protein [Paraphysoderma sedebokerense]|nr:ammonium transporter AmtB-like domain-containing protein [Paraphysoderma sedebokerense]